MWTVKISYEDASNFLTDKTLLSAAINSVVDYLNSFVAGTGSINLTVQVTQTATGRFGGTGAILLDHTTDGVNYYAPSTLKELAAGTNLNGTQADLLIVIDPFSTYFQSLSFDAGAYTAPRTVPSDKTDGQTVLLHEIMHGMGFGTYRNWTTGEFWDPKVRSLMETFVQKSGSGLVLAVPEFAKRGLAPIQLTTDSDTQNYSHLGNHASLDQGYVDDLMNGLYFYLGTRYYMSQVDLMILSGLGYKVTIPDDLALSYYSIDGKGQVKPALADSALPASMTTNVLHLSGTAAAGAMTSVLEHGKLLATTTADATGHWTMDVTVDPSRTTSALVIRDGSHAVDSNAVAVSRNADAGLHLFGSSQYAKLVGSSHADLFTAGPRGASIDGGAGFDIVEYSGKRAASTIQKQGDAFMVKDATGTDTLTGIERVRFSDGAVAFDVGSDGIAGEAYRLYQAAFNRAPDAAGLGYWISAMDHGAGLLDVANQFVASAEFKTLYGAQPSNAAILERYYENVLHREADAGGFAYWLDVLDRHAATAADVLASFSQSPENQAAVATVIGSGISYTPFV